VKLGRLLAGLAGQLLQLTRESGIDGWASRDGPGVGADARWITGVGRHLAIEFRGSPKLGAPCPCLQSPRHFQIPLDLEGGIPGRSWGLQAARGDAWIGGTAHCVGN